MGDTNEEQDEDVYSEEILSEMVDDDEISAEEAGFMVGYTSG